MCWKRLLSKWQWYVGNSALCNPNGPEACQWVPCNYALCKYMRKHVYWEWCKDDMINITWYIGRCPHNSARFQYISGYQLLGDSCSIRTPHTSELPLSAHFIMRTLLAFVLVSCLVAMSLAQDINYDGVPDYVDRNLDGKVCLSNKI